MDETDFVLRGTRVVIVPGKPFQYRFIVCQGLFIPVPVQSLLAPLYQLRRGNRIGDIHRPGETTGNEKNAHKKAG
jgi:hypothetical protein